MDIVYDLNIIGGDFDGTPGLQWRDDGSMELPALIHVGVCATGMDCGSSACKLRVAHVSFWTVDEDEQPTRYVRYTKENVYVERDDEGDVHGRADYAVGGLLDPRNFGEAARRLPGEKRSKTFAAAGHSPLAAGRHERGWPR